MNILKIGKAHIDVGTNCQDAISRYEDELKIICDGCSGGTHSEVGAKLFVKLFTEKYKYFASKGKYIINERSGVERLIQSTMDDIVKFVGNDIKTILDYLCFTIVISHECMLDEEPLSFSETFFVGDGYLIKIDKSTSEVSFINLSGVEYPEYLSYNYINPESLSLYKNGANIHYTVFDPRCMGDYDIGVASDGIRFIVNRPEDDPIRMEFVDIILSDNEIKMKRFINKHPEIFKDDVSIVI